MPSDAIVEVKDICFAHPRGETLLDQVDFTLKTGDKTGLIGPNGVGKTTLLQIIMGLLKPTSGSVLYRGREIVAENDFQELRKHIGFVFQNADDQLFCPTVLEDVAFGPLNLGHSPDEARDMAMDTLNTLNLKGFEDRVTHKLSGGEKKLVALATVLVMQPEVLLLDEPTAGLDETTRERIAGILNDLTISYVLVSHEFDFLAQTTHTIYGLKNGRILYNGDSSALHSHFHSHALGTIPHKHNA